jgi:DNA-directed RNA polymerase subunit RPC12/RpoP
VSTREFDASSFEDDEKEKAKLRRDKQGYLRDTVKRYEFDCPVCDANNPYDDGFSDGDEMRCNYCGQDLLVQLTEAGKIKFKQL